MTAGIRKEVKAVTNRERERMTLDFQKPDRGAVEETFFPWMLTAQRFREEGMPAEIADCAADYGAEGACMDDVGHEKYFKVGWGDRILAYERYFGLDPVRRVHFILPFRRFEEKIIESTSEYTIRQDMCGRHNIRRADGRVEIAHRQIITCTDDWERLKRHAEAELERYYTNEAIDAVYGPLREGHERGDYSVRMNLEGFFWMPRELMGNEEQLYAFYDEPELLHDICRYMLKVYMEKLPRVLDLIEPDVVYLMEDLSGKNGPMISNTMFDEFVGDYYRVLFPMMRAHGVHNIFVDTDGDFMMMIRHFMDAGVDGFLPMDVNAGMDIVKVREKFPTLKIIGGYNKLRIAEGRDAIDREFERILPVVRQGGYIVGADHQVPPSASMENYSYYICRLREVMEQCGVDL